jgi:hypothetical protein
MICFIANLPCVSKQIDTLCAIMNLWYYTSMIKRVLIAAGGTGGHIFPALAIAHLLQKNSIEVSWLGAKRGLESTIISQTDIPLYTISVARLRGKKAYFAN